MSKIAVMGELTAHPGAFDQLFALMQKHAAASRAEAGCLRFDLMVPLEAGTDRLLLHELWEDRAALDAHGGTERMKQHRAATGPLIAKRHLDLCELRDGG